MSVGAKVFVVTSAEDADEIVKTFEENTTSKFVTAKQKKSFGKEIDPRQLNARILWEDIANHKAMGHRLKFDGTPFMVAGLKILDCHHGVDRHTSAKAKYKARRESDEIVACKRRRLMTKETKKFGCPAKIRMREILKFPKYRISVDTKVNRLRSAKRLREDIKGPKDDSCERRIYVELPSESDHCNHMTGEASGQTQRMDKAIARFVHAQVYAGLRSVPEIKFCVKEFVKNQLFRGRNMPPLTNRRYHPTDQDIRNHIYIAKARNKGEEHHCEDVIGSLIHWSPGKSHGFVFVDESSVDVANVSRHSFSSKVADLASIKHKDSTDCEGLSDIKVESHTLGINQVETGHIDCDDETCNHEMQDSTSPVTIHLQIEPETTKAMAIDCQNLLRTIHEQTSHLKDPNVLHQLHTTLHEVVLTLNTKISEAGAGPDTSPRQPQEEVVRIKLPRMSLLEKELRRTHYKEKKNAHRSLLSCNGPEFSDSDYEVHCETQPSNTDDDLVSGEVQIIVTEDPT